MATIRYEFLELHKEDETRTRLAALTICEHASDLEDARFLLKAAGIIPDPEAKPIHYVVKLGEVSTRVKPRNRRNNDDE